MGRGSLGSCHATHPTKTTGGPNTASTAPSKSHRISQISIRVFEAGIQGNSAIFLPDRTARGKACLIRVFSDGGPANAVKGD